MILRMTLVTAGNDHTAAYTFYASSCDLNANFSFSFFVKLTDFWIFRRRYKIEVYSKQTNWTFEADWSETRVDWCDKCCACGQPIAPLPLATNESASFARTREIYKETESCRRRRTIRTAVRNFLFCCDWLSWIYRTQETMRTEY